MKRFHIITALVAGLALLCGAAFAAPAEGFALAHGLAQFDVPTTAQLLGMSMVGSIKMLQSMNAKRSELLAQMSAITTAAEQSDGGMLSEDQRTKFDALNTQVQALDGDIGRVRAQVEATRAGSAVELPDGRIETSDNLRDSPNHGFRSFGEFAMACVQASGPGAQVDQRLQVEAASTAPTNYGNTSSGADGGYVVPPEYSSNIIETAYNEQQSFVPLTDNTPIGGNGMTFPVDETTPWGSSGIKAYWDGEGAASTDSKSKFDPATMRLKKLTALVPLTEELLADATAMGAYVSKKTPEAIMFKTNEALWGGSGAGKPKGFYAATGLLVSVAKETSQVADTIVAQNISKMRARMSSRSWRRAIWHINNDALPQLDNLLYATGQTNAVIYKPEGGRFGYGTLLGRDVMVTDFNETVGDKGDIVLADWGMYRTITKSGGIETATSMHFWFDRGLTAFRAVFRIDGQPSIQAPVTPNKGSNSLSPIVTLDARA